MPDQAEETGQPIVKQSVSRGFLRKSLKLLIQLWRMNTHCPLVLTRPGKSQGSRQNGRPNNDAHHEVEVPHRDTCIVQTDRKGGDEDCVAHDEGVAHPDETLSARIRLEIRAIAVHTVC